MIENIEQLRATQEMLRSMEEGLATLGTQLLPQFPERFIILAQPYRDEILRLRAEIDQFLQLALVQDGVATGNLPG